MDPAIPALITAADTGHRASTETLFRALYDDLHRRARRELARGGPGMTIGPTTLLHEAYIEMSRCADGAFPDRARFMAYAARVMRGLIIDYVRNRQAQKRGGGFQITRVDANLAQAPEESPRLQEVSDALDALLDIDADLAEIVDLKFFCGFSFAEIAATRGISERTVYRQWERARVYLYQALGARDTALDDDAPIASPS